MKTDLLTSIVIAIAGVAAGFIVTNMLLAPIEPVSVTSIESSVNANLAEPDPEVFNYRALNPTVEVYVGNCEEYNDLGECVESNTEPAPQEGE